jgi:hypothetical protein
MDPYLEDPALWSHFHTSLMVLLQLALAQRLPSGFVARVETRVYILPDEREVRPDAVVFATAPNRRSNSNIATQEKTHAPEIVLRHRTVMEERYLEVRDVRHGGREVVASIEVLSPANKEPDSIGLREYRRKQDAVLASGTHLLELDLRRGGEHVVAVPEEVAKEAGPYDYLCCLSDATRRDEYLFWRLSLRESLPAIDLPLTPDVAPVPIDFQAIFNRCYDEGRLGDDIDYTLPPHLPLTASILPELP